MRFVQKTLRYVWTMVLILVWSVTPGYCQSDLSTSVNAVMVTDGRTMSFQAPGLTDFHGGFSATIISRSQTQVLSSALGTSPATQERTTEATPYGTATVTAVTIRFASQRPRVAGGEIQAPATPVFVSQPTDYAPAQQGGREPQDGNEQVDLLFRLGQVPGVPCLLAQAGIRNAGPSPVKLVSVTPLALAGQVAGNPAEWLFTALDVIANSGLLPVLPLGEIKKPLRVNEYGGLYRSDGTGFLFGPVGMPIAYVEATIAHDEDGKLSFAYSADMSGVQVDPGETRWGQQVVLLAEPPQKALSRWADWVGKTHGARTDKGAMSGWNSWSFHGKGITGTDVLAEVNAVLQSHERLRPAVMQIDAVGYSLSLQNEDSESFPEGRTFYAQRIAATGARPGLIMTFNGPPGWNNTVEKVRRVVRSGYCYIKINRTGLLLPPEDINHKTVFESKRQGFAALREAAGAGTYLLYNDSHPDRATVGMMDANRIGREAERQLIRDAIIDLLRSYHLNGRWFATDSGCYFMGTDVPNVSEIAGGWPVVRTWMSMVGLSCGAAFTGDPWHLESFRPYWRNVEVMSPPAKERTEVVDLCLSNEWPRLVGHVRRDWGDMTVALLWNPGKKERAITLDFAAAGLDPSHNYAVWSFWDNRYLGVAKGSWTTPAMEESASQHLRFTDLDSTPGWPVLVGSGLHIYCGAAEIKHVQSSRGSLEIELTDAGARDGDLFVYSRLPVILRTAIGCNVTGIAQAGENAWRISLADRKRGLPQRIALGIVLPVTRQSWFWTMCGLLAASVVFGVWKYLASVRMQLALLRLQREQALDRERTRIARDIHDGLGVNLTQIAMQCELMRNDVDKPALMSHHVAELSESSQAVARALDEIVWAVTPINDTAGKFVTFVGHFVESSVQAAGLACRLELPVDVLDLPMSATVRHHLFLVLKEALNNAIHHAAARTVNFSIVFAGRDLTIRVADDGCGFDPDNLSKPIEERVFGGNGLSNMRKRMEEIGGTLEINSAPGCGTTLTLRFSV